MTGSGPIVSIIIPCYLQAQYLPDALDSILAQTYPHWEAIVVNDASPDNTKEIAGTYASRDARITLLNLEQNAGLPNARNSGIKATKGVFILPLDADDKIAPTYLEKSLQVFNESPSVKVVYTDVQCFGIRQDKVQRHDPDLKALCRQNLFQPTAMYRRSDFEKTKGYRVKIGYEDWDLWLQLIDRNEDAFRIPEPLFFFHCKEKSMIKDLQAERDKALAVRKQVLINNLPKIRKYAPDLVPAEYRSLAKKIRTALKRPFG